MFRIVIPARHDSSRFPGKPLALIRGRPMILRVHDRALEAGAAEVVVATDDERIARVAREGGAEVCMTSRDHASGTDRIAEVARARGFGPREIIVNLQGDEPRMPAAIIRQVARLLEEHPGAAIATAAAALRSEAEYHDPNVVKVVTARDSRALYFSRAPIPWNRDAPPQGWRQAFRHIGLYAYRSDALARLAAWAPTPLELDEKLEQLRALEHGLDIRVAIAAEPPGADVNTPEDLARLEHEFTA